MIGKQCGLIKKDSPDDYTEYIQALTAYWNIIGLDKETGERRLKELRDLGIKF